MPDKTVPQHTTTRVYSPCYMPDGSPYCLVVLEGRHPNLSGSPLRVHGTGVRRDLARAAALVNWDQAYRRLWESPPGSTR